MRVAWSWMGRAALVGLAMGLLSVGASASAQDRDPEADARARAHYERGVTLFDEGLFQGALAEFEAAYELTQRVGLLFNIGQLHARLGHAVEATEMLERYLAEAGEIPAERRTQVETEILSQRDRIARVTVTSSVAGSHVSLDDVDRGSTPLEAPILVGVGEHVLVVSADGHETSRNRFRLAGGQERSFDIQLVRLGAVQGPETASPFPVLTVAGAVVAGAGLVTWAAAGAVTLSEDARLDGECGTRVCTSADTGTIEVSRIAADVGLGVLVVGGVLTVVGALLELGGSGEAEGGQVSLGAEGVEVVW
ncbi:MAG: PEGA domain-containing protein [Sandaracinaceae bacterium]|nr:PEGA domain-containing protein [Sandaracinaceae bacterium]